MKILISALRVSVPLLLLFLPTAQSATWTWDGGGTATLWNSGNNWDLNTVPVNNGTADISLNNTGSAPTNQNMGALSINSLVNTTNATLQISGSPITIGAGGINNSGGFVLRFMDFLVSASANQSWGGGQISPRSGVSVAAGQTLTLNDGANTNDYEFGGTGGAGTGTILLGANAGASLLTLTAFGSAALEIGTGGTGTTAFSLGNVTTGSTLANAISIGTRTGATDSFRIGSQSSTITNSSYTFSGNISGNLNAAATNARGLVFSGGPIASTRMLDFTLSGNNSGLTGAGSGLNEIAVSDSIALIVGNSNALGNQTSNTPTVALGDNGGTTLALSAALLTSTASTFNNAISLDRAATGVLTVGGIHTSGTATFTGNVTAQHLGDNSGTGANTFNVFQAGGGTTVFSGTITNNGTGAAASVTSLTKSDLSNTTVGAVNRSNNGTVELSGANTYSGNTTINAGTLLVTNTTGSGTGTGTVNVSSTATLGGTGRIAPTGANGIRVSANGILAPGATGIGNMTIALGGTTGNVTMLTDATFKFDLGTANANIGTIAAGSSDLLVLTSDAAGDFVFNSNNIDFGNTGTGVGYYKLFDTSLNATTWTNLTYNGTTGLVTSGLTASNFTGGPTANFIVGTAGNGGDLGDIYLNVIPEPSTATLLLGLGLLLAGRRRPRQH